MYPEIKNKMMQALNYLRVQIIFILRFILNEMWPIIKNQVSKLLNDPNARVVFLVVLAWLALIIGSGNDLGGS